MMKSRKILFLAITIGLFLDSCQEIEIDTYFNRLGIKTKDQFNSCVIILDYGCKSCEEDFYRYALSQWPDSSALVFKRKPEPNTLVNFQTLFEKSFVFIDSLDISYNLKLTKKNTEMTLIKDGRISYFSFLDYENLILNLEKTRE